MHDNSRNGKTIKTIEIHESYVIVRFDDETWFEVSAHGTEEQWISTDSGS